MAQQTAVNILVTYMLENFHLTDESLEKFQQAKEMEKEQIMMAFNDGKVNTVLKKRNSEQYYNETYNK